MLKIITVGCIWQALRAFAYYVSIQFFKEISQLESRAGFWQSFLHRFSTSMALKVLPVMYLKAACGGNRLNSVVHLPLAIRLRALFISDFFAIFER
jgi:hypothetical protein